MGVLEQELHFFRFIVYKLPKIPKSNNGYIQDGVGFFYMDVNSPKWVLSEVPINMTGQHALYNTLQQIYANKVSVHSHPALKIVIFLIGPLVMINYYC